MPPSSNNGPSPRPSRHPRHDESTSRLIGCTVAPTREAAPPTNRRSREHCRPFGGMGLERCRRQAPGLTRRQKRAAGSEAVAGEHRVRPGEIGGLRDVAHQRPDRHPRRREPIPAGPRRSEYRTPRWQTATVGLVVGDGTFGVALHEDRITPEGLADLGQVRGRGSRGRGGGHRDCTKPPGRPRAQHATTGQPGSANVTTAQPSTTHYARPATRVRSAPTSAA